MANKKDPADLSKTAEYYLKRIKDLPSAMRDKLSYLQNEAASKRILMLSVQELCDLLELDYNKDSFESNCREHFFMLSAFLEQMGLKFVPCSIPVDLQFEDPIFIVPRPNLENDEDFAAVKDLLANKRKPNSKDLMQISNTNEKLANYNIMLRVFEALFVICSNRLGPHQRICLMQIINQLTFPAEGLFYLRACYTFASERRNYHCDFSDPKYCFKPLNAEQQQRICSYLALIAAHGTYTQAFAPDYPYLKELEAAFIRLSPSRARFLEQQHLEQPVEENVQTNSLAAKLKAQNHSRMHQKTHLPLPDEKHSSSCVAAAHMHCQGALLQILKDARRKYVQVQPLLDFARLKVLRLKQQKTAERYLFYTQDEQLYDLFSICLYAEQDPESILKTQGKQSFLNYLLKEESNEQNETLRLLWYSFIALILKPALKGYAEEQCQEFITNLKQEYAQGGRADLLFIYALHYVLFRADAPEYDSEKQLEEDELLKLALFNYPHLLRLLVYKQPSAVQDRPQLYALLSLRLALEEVLPSTELGKFFNASFFKLFTDLAPEREKITDYLRQSSLQQYQQLTVYQSDPNLSSALNLILNNIYVKACISPLLVRQNLEHYSGYKWELDKSYRPKIRAHYQEFRNEYRYLLSLKGDNCPTLARLILGTFTDAERTTLQQRMHNFNYQSNLELFSALNTPYSQQAELCLDLALYRINLIRLPLESAIPHGVLPSFKGHRVVFAKELPSEYAPQIINRLSAGQMTIILLSFILPNFSFTDKLCACLDLPEPYLKFAKSFFEQVRQLAGHERPYTVSMYKNFGAQIQGTETAVLLTKYLKALYRAILLQTNYNSQIARKFSELFSYLHIKAQDFNDRDSVTQPKTERFKSLDQKLISSKLKESLEVQEVISKLRDEEQQAEQRSALTAVETHSAAQASTAQNAEDAIALPENIRELLRAIAAQRSEILDLGEFTGLCLSLKFMSADAAVEEINDLCYEQFDEALFELAPEERSIYISTDLLHKLCD
ncbi:MAG: hypothetical protein K6F05_07140 [Succinivibrio sp.]|nr:hypothetical protein [Succinivibrio sp.]